MYKKYEGFLEDLIPILLIFLLSNIALYFGISQGIVFIVQTALFIMIAILIRKSDAFYKIYLNILFCKDKLETYLNDKFRKEHSWFYIIGAIIGLYILHDVFYIEKTFSASVNTYNMNDIYFIAALLVNSLIGVYLYKKFKNNKQYICSCVIFAAIFIAYIV